MLHQTRIVKWILTRMRKKVERLVEEQGAKAEKGIQGQENGTKVVVETKRSAIQAVATVEVGAFRLTLMGFELFLYLI